MEGGESGWASHVPLLLKNEGGAVGSKQPSSRKPVCRKAADPENKELNPEGLQKTSNWFLKIVVQYNRMVN